MKRILDKCGEYRAAHEAVKNGHYPYFLAFQDSDGTSASVNGQSVVMAGSNNYLGLTKDPRVVHAGVSAMRKFGSSCTGSRLLNGNLFLHEQLEEELADLLGKPAALVFSTGYGANVGTVSGLIQRGDVALLDREAHASAVDGARMTPGTVRAFGHNRADDLRRQLMRCPEEATLVIVDGVYSMSGDVCHLDEIVEVCQEFGATLLVDDAHGLGVLGDAAGTCCQFGLTAQVDLITVTFSKSFASIGGAVASDPDTIHYLRHHARSGIFSASMTPASAATALAALRIAKAEPWRAEQAMANASFVRSGLKALGLDVGDGTTPIVPIYTASVTETLTAWRRLLDLGVYTNAVLPPAASSRLRTSFSAGHTRHQLGQVVEAFGSAVSEGILIRSDQDVA